jgi:hypothetical protein
MRIIIMPAGETDQKWIHFVILEESMHFAAELRNLFAKNQFDFG